eukprot:scaffold18602_cov47-Phaeocystis_antarctica.AAC.1
MYTPRIPCAAYGLPFRSVLLASHRSSKKHVLTTHYVLTHDSPYRSVSPQRRQKPKGSLGRSRSPEQRSVHNWLCGGTGYHTGAADGMPADGIPTGGAAGAGAGACAAGAGAGADGDLDALRRGTSDDGGYGYGAVAAADAAADAQRRLSA